MALGIGAAVILFWITFFASPGMVEVFTLVATVVALIWVSTVDAHRLVDDAGRPQMMLFGLALLAMALLITASSMMIGRSGTVLVTATIGIVAVVIGFVRAIRVGMEPPPTEE